MVHTVPMRRPPIALVTAVVVAALLVGACSASDGRTLPPADPPRSTTSGDAPVVAQPSDGGDESTLNVFVLGSAAFADGSPIPDLYTCAGAGISPPLDWASTPPAAELALVVRDRDAGGLVHWVVTGIDPLVQGIGEDGVPEGAVEAANGWFGPCPTTGTHVYVFVLHAVPEPLGLAPGRPAAEAAELVEGASSAQATLTGTATGD